MARETVERLIDDIDGSEAHASIQFVLDGVSWSIDLNAEHEAQLRAALGPFVDAARPLRATRPGRTPRSTADAGHDKGRNPAIRRWAQAVGVELPSRGRIASAVKDAFDAQDVSALYATVGLESEQSTGPGRRPMSAEFSSAE